MMTRTTFGKAAISSLIVATTMVGCSRAAFHPRASVSQPKGDPAKLAAKAAEALDDRCPNCGGELMDRPTRTGKALAGNPASTVRYFKG